MKKLSLNTVMFLMLCTALGLAIINADAKGVRQKKQGADTLSVIIQKAKAGDAVAQNILGLWYYDGLNVKQNYQEAAIWWAQSAKQENSEGIGNLALCYQLGRGLKADSLRALALYEKAIKLGNKNILPQHEKLASKSLFSAQLLYNCYSKGIGTNKDKGKARQYEERLAAFGNSDRKFNLALDYINAKQPQNAITWLQKASKEGHTGATFYLGKLIFQGLGISQDKEKGFSLMKKTADEDFPGGCLEVGKILLSGDGVQKDAQKGFEYLEKVAGISGDAGWLIGLCYMRGEGCQQDYHKAVQWLSEYFESHKKDFNELLRADNEGPFSQYLMGLRKLFVDKDYIKAIDYFEKVDKAKIPEGKTMSGLCYTIKDNAKYNPKKAFKYLSKASNSSKLANYFLSHLYEKGMGVKKDEGKALILLTKAANDGIASAQCELGDRFMTGDGVSQDLTKAAKLYLQAESQRLLSKQSAKNLARCYQERVAALPDLNNTEKRMEKLLRQRDNNNLTSLLKLIEE